MICPLSSCLTLPEPPALLTDGRCRREVVSDTEAVLAEELGEPSPLHAVCQGAPSSYDVMAAVDQAAMFEAVHLALSRGSCIGIFPEGGSHDNTDLLPLKVRALPPLCSPPFPISHR